MWDNLGDSTRLRLIPNGSLPLASTPFRHDHIGAEGNRTPAADPIIGARLELQLQIKGDSQVAWSRPCDAFLYSTYQA